MTAFADRFEVSFKLGAGSFGVVLLATDNRTSSEVALKLERIDCRVPQLKREFKIMAVLKDIPHVPAVLWFGPGQHSDTPHVGMAMELCGLSLQKMMGCFRGSLRLKDVLMIADHILEGLQAIHENYFVHRDLKPDNICLSLDSGSLKIIDFGLAYQYFSRRTGHVAYKDGLSLTGTSRFVSVNTHTGIRQSRRDDLETLAYVLIYLLKGTLPWQGFTDPDRATRYQRLAQTKATVSMKILCADIPSEFAKFVTYARSLKFAQKPDYDALRRMFAGVFEKEAFENDGEFQWTVHLSSRTLSSTDTADIESESEVPLARLRLTGAIQAVLGGIAWEKQQRALLGSEQREEAGETLKNRVVAGVSGHLGSFLAANEGDFDEEDDDDDGRLFQRHSGKGKGDAHLLAPHPAVVKRRSLGDVAQLAMWAKTHGKKFDDADCSGEDAEKKDTEHPPLVMDAPAPAVRVAVASLPVEEPRLGDSTVLPAIPESHSPRESGGRRGLRANSRDRFQSRSRDRLPALRTRRRSSPATVGLLAGLMVPLGSSLSPLQATNKMVTLSVSVCEGRGLAAKDFLTGLSDPYCVVYLSTMIAERFLTSVVKNSLNPRWNETFQLTFPQDGMGMLHIECWDKDNHTSDDFLGQITMPLSSIPAVSNTWFDLQGRGKSELVTGSLRLALQRDAPPAPYRLTPSTEGSDPSHAASLRRTTEDLDPLQPTSIRRRRLSTSGKDSKRPA